MKFQGLIKTIGGTVSRNSPTILTSLGVAGVVATTVMGGRDTIKAIRILDELDPDNEFTNKEKIKETYKCYIPTMIMGAVTIGCIIGANSINAHRNTILAGLYSLSEKTLNEYQAKVVEKIGGDKAREIREDIAKDRLKNDPVSKYDVIMGRGDTLCYDELASRYFYGDMESIKSAVNRINVRMRNDMFVPLNDLYSELNLDHSVLGDLVGWYIDDGAFDPEFSSQLADDGRPCLVMGFSSNPRSIDRDF